jgi:SLBB domain
MLLPRTLLLLAMAVLCLAQEGENRKTFTVTGNVKRPGRYELKNGARVVDAINRAGGLDGDTDQNAITIVRKAKRYDFDYEAYLQGERVEENILLENGDVIVVRDAQPSISIAAHNSSSTSHTYTITDGCGRTVFNGTLRPWQTVSVVVCMSGDGYRRITYIRENMSQWTSANLLFPGQVVDLQ